MICSPGALLIFPHCLSPAAYLPPRGAQPMTSHVSSPAQARRRLGPPLAVRLPYREE